MTWTETVKAVIFVWCQLFSYDLDLLQIIVPDAKEDDRNTINRLPDLRLLSCGYEHAAVIRNNSVYTMGVATSGCLGN